MLSQVAGGLCITFVQEPANIPTISAFASCSSTLENVAQMLLLILNPWGWSKEDINW
jgi:hypothetical protein